MATRHTAATLCRQTSAAATRIARAWYSSAGTASPRSTAPAPFQVFDRNVKRMQRDRAARDVETSRMVDYVKDEVAFRVVDRLLDIKRDFNEVVELGSGAGHIAKHVDTDMMKKLIMCDMSETMLKRDQDVEYEVPVERLVVDEEQLPFAENSLEAVVSSLSMHWVNDLPGAMIQIQRSLKPDGVFIAGLFGGDTLFELRTSLQLAEQDREGGISPRVSPMADSRDLGALLSRAGFTLTTVDVDEVTVNYPSAIELMQDLRAMGESNAVLTRRAFLKRDTMMAAAAIYQEMYGNPDGSVPATFQILYMIGWKPSPTQFKPLERGTSNGSPALHGSNSPPSSLSSSSHGRAGSAAGDYTALPHQHALASSTPTDTELTAAQLRALSLGASTVVPPTTALQPTPSGAVRTTPTNTTTPHGPEIEFTPEDFGLTQDALPPYSEEAQPIPIQEQEHQHQQEHTSSPANQQYLTGGSVSRTPSLASSISAHSPRNPFVPTANNAPPSPSYAPPLPRRPSTSPSPVSVAPLAPSPHVASTNPFHAESSTGSTSTSDNHNSASASATTRVAAPKKEDEPHTEYVLKPIDWIDPATGIEKRIKIITQNENGPCPLLALCNTLILQGKVEIKPYDRPSIRYDHLLSILAEYLLAGGDQENASSGNATSPTNGRSGARVEAERQRSRYEVESALRILPRLEHGLDVNVFFKSIRGFENTPELGLFHSFGVELVHGWIVNPELDPAMYRLVDGPAQITSYNKAVECIVKGDDVGGGWVVEDSSGSGASGRRNSHRGSGGNNNNNGFGSSTTTTDDSARSEQISHALTVQEFLASTSTQLTHYGLGVLHESLPEGHLCAFFRNNHFCTLFKNPMDGTLYTLVTDQSLAHELAIVWESLEDVDGAGNFLDGLFRQGALEVGDYARSTQPTGHGSGHDGSIGGLDGGGDEDFALALQLQQQEEEEEERRRRQQQQQPQQQQQGQGHNSNNRTSYDGRRPSSSSSPLQPSLGVVAQPVPGLYQAHSPQQTQALQQQQQHHQQPPYPIPAGAGPLNAMALDPFAYHQETDEEMAQRLNREFHQEYLREQQQRQPQPTPQPQQQYQQPPPPQQQQQQQQQQQLYQASSVNNRHSYDPTRVGASRPPQGSMNGHSHGRHRYSSDGSGSTGSNSKEKCTIM
ncbi:hypothetical protein DFQ27_002117 [Actinomortierella ambigua]|uniref:Methyltransferase type 11 domain-containing protein n=1 Tax=Actinomortierella ambigua TaxID=1343610 RepID=A0A9P6U7Q4_9FUNG|nr:hypothetical protein DFQ27_002117 [Actinomortierella ambigua]